MRVTSDLFVSALVRRVFGVGGFAAVVRRGAHEAGAIFIVARDRLGVVSLYGPAPQTSYDDAHPADRQFSLLLSTENEVQVTARLDREMRFDTDVWVVELELGNDQAIETYVTLTTP